MSIQGSLRIHCRSWWSVASFEGLSRTRDRLRSTSSAVGGSPCFGNFPSERCGFKRRFWEMFPVFLLGKALWNIFERPKKWRHIPPLYPQKLDNSSTGTRSWRFPGYTFFFMWWLHENCHGLLRWKISQTKNVHPISLYKGWSFVSIDSYKGQKYPLNQKWVHSLKLT